MAEENKKFTDTVEKLSAASDKLDRAAEKMSDTSDSFTGSAGGSFFSTTASLLAGFSAGGTTASLLAGFSAGGTTASLLAGFSAGGTTASLLTGFSAGPSFSFSAAGSPHPVRIPETMNRMQQVGKRSRVAGKKRELAVECILVFVLFNSNVDVNYLFPWRQQ